MNVQWHEGMLLSPHHFQQMSNHIQQLFALSGTNCFNYGFFDLKIDTSALSSGVVRILQAKGVFQDGLFFDFNALKDSPLEKNLSEYFKSNNAALKIYLGVYAHRTGENVVTGNNSRYYSVEVQNISDENSGQNPINIPVLKPKLRLLTEDELDPRYIAFPITEIQKSIEGAIQQTDFIPPFITINEYSKIAEMCRVVAQKIRDKVSYFADRKDNFAQDSTDVALTNLRLLIKALLPMEALVRVNNIHPFVLYQCVLQAATDIIATNPSQLIPRLPMYEHNDLFATFSNLLRHITNILNMLKQKYIIVHFDREGSLFRLSLKKEWIEKDELIIGVQKAFSSTESDNLNWINSAQIASESMLPLIKDHRIIGADRKILERGSYVTQPNGTTMVSIKKGSSYIKQNENLCIINSSYPIIPDSVVLYAEC